MASKGFRKRQRAKRAATISGPATEAFPSPVPVAPVAASVDPRREGLLARLWRRPDVRFMLAFVGVAGVLFSIYSFPYPEDFALHRFWNGYLQVYAAFAGHVLKLFEPGVMVSGQDIIGRFSLRIVRGCDAVDAQVLTLAAVVASQGYPWRWRLAGVLAGFLAITLVNVVRICGLYYAGIFAPAYFDMLHHEVWPLVIIAAAVGVYLGWAKLAKSFGGIARAEG